MRILVLAKRQYTNQDLIDNRYGRLYELPKELARLGHLVTGFCLSYRLRKEGHLHGPKVNGELVDWYSVNVGKLILPGIRTYLNSLHSLCTKFIPDVILASSDALHIVHGVHIARKFNIPCVVDLYDNYESFALTKMPGLLSNFKRSIGQATGVICVSNTLKDYVQKQYNPLGMIKVLPNGIPAEHFYPMNRFRCRAEFGLPVNAKIIGTAGAIGESRGIDVLFRAAERLIADDSSIHLALAGPMESGTVLPQGPNIHYLGKLEYKKVPKLFNSLDVGIICNKESPFGRYCFPQKAYEMLACKLPIVAANVGSMAELLTNYPGCCLYDQNDYRSLKKVVKRQLLSPIIPDIEIQVWAKLAHNLEIFLQNINIK